MNEPITALLRTALKTCGKGGDRAGWPQPLTAPSTPEVWLGSPLLLASSSPARTCIAASRLTWQLRANGKQARAQFEEALTGRYREIVGALPVWSFFDLEELTSEQLARIGEEKTLSAYYRYFDLCNEQAFLNEKERLDPKTWAEWRTGIAANVRRQAFRTAWEESIRPNIGEDFREFKALYKELAAEQSSVGALARR